ncbi:CHC2 zinc finger domain-containing protein [Pseudoxanthomonas kaohsiungensis]|uniref:CHC2 zinc finger domain-containing protein n=2 Tax=Pseudoxanthomonas kaohsiungensis TaxID=283923 RepID=A0ABW3LV87_9GAMM
MRASFDCDPTRPVQAVLDRLDGVRRAGRDWIALCPAHDDRSPSLAIASGDADVVLLHCFAGCAASDVVHSIGLTLADLFPRPRGLGGPRTRNRISAEARFRAAFSTVLHEATIIEVAASDLAKRATLSEEDRQRLIEAVERIHQAWEVLRGHRNA